MIAREFFMKGLMLCTRIAGVWFMRIMAWLIACGYFVFHQKRVKASMDLYAGVFPGRSPLFYRRCAWKQFQDFSASYSDKINLDMGGNIDLVQKGFENFEKAAKEGSGGLVLMSHVGIWEIAARLHRRMGLKILAVMGEREPRHVARFQREEMKEDGLAVMVSSQGERTPFDGLEALEFLGNGGFVGMAGDLSWVEGPRTVKTSLFGRRVFLPAAPHMMALLSGSPLFTFFAFRTGKNRCYVEISKPRWLRAETRAERREVIRESVHEYAKRLEDAIRRFPWQWHVFEPLLGPPLDRER